LINPRARDRQRIQYLDRNTETFGIGDHSSVQTPRDIEITLVEIQIPSLLQLWLIPTFHFPDVEEFNIPHIVQHEEPREGNG